MAGGNRFSVSHGRGFAAVALAVFGLFVICFGAGLGNAGVFAVGVAIGVLGPVLLLVTAARANTREYTYGTAHVHSASPPPSAGMVGRCELHLSVYAHGIDGVAVRVLDPAVPVSKWPDDGATLPVEVASHNARKVRVLWDKVLTHGQASGEDLYPEYVTDERPADEEDLFVGASFPSDADDDYPDDHGALPPVSPGPRAPTVAPIEVHPSTAPPVVVSSAAAVVGPGRPVGPAFITPPAAPAPRSRPSPRPSVRPRKAPDDLLDAGRADTGGGPPGPGNGRAATVVAGPDVGPVVGPASGWPAPGQAPEFPVRPESQPEPDDTDVVAGTVERAPYPGAALHGTVHDAPTGYPDRSETDRTEIDRPGVERGGSDPGGFNRAGGRAGRILEGQTVEPPPAPAGSGYDPTGDGPTGGRDGSAHLLATLGAGRAQDARSVDGLTLTVRDLDRSVAFYRDTLGLTEAGPRGDTVVMTHGEVRIRLSRVADPQPVDRRTVHLEVPDVRESYAGLRDAGFGFVEPPRVVSHGAQYERWAALLRDPDGHAVALTSWEKRG